MKLIKSSLAHASELPYCYIILIRSFTNYFQTFRYDVSVQMPLPTKKLGPNMRYLKEHMAQNGAVPWDSSTPASNLGILIHQYEDKVLLFGGSERVKQSAQHVADILNLELVTEIVCRFSLILLMNQPVFEPTSKYIVIVF